MQFYQKLTNNNFFFRIFLEIKNNLLVPNNYGTRK